MFSEFDSHRDLTAADGSSHMIKAASISAAQAISILNSPANKNSSKSSCLSSRESSNSISSLTSTEIFPLRRTSLNSSGSASSDISIHSLTLSNTKKFLPQPPASVIMAEARASLKFPKRPFTPASRLGNGTFNSNNKIGDDSIISKNAIFESHNSSERCFINIASFLPIINFYI
jgi:hypothetical protein